MNVELGRNRLRAILHMPSAKAANAVLMVAGAGGGLQGPYGMYLSLGRKLQKSGVLALRLDYRHSNNLALCVEDVVEAIRELHSEYGVNRVVLVGWSFGGAVVITAGSQNDNVIGVCTVASQTYGTDTVGDLAPRALLLLHGTADTCLGDNCSKQLYRRAKEPKKLILFEEDDHQLSHNYDKAESAIYDFSISLFNTWSRQPNESPEAEEEATVSWSGTKRRHPLLGGDAGKASGVVIVPQAAKKHVTFGSVLGGLLGHLRSGRSELKMGTSLPRQKSEPILVSNVKKTEHTTTAGIGSL